MNSAGPKNPYGGLRGGGRLLTNENRVFGKMVPER
jgi:hypothetical protein